MQCYIADFRLYSMVYSLLKGPWDVKKAFFWLYRPFFGYIPPSIAKKGGIFLERRWYVAKVVYSLIGIYDIPEPGWFCYCDSLSLRLSGPAAAAFQVRGAAPSHCHRDGHVTQAAAARRRVGGL